MGSEVLAARRLGWGRMLDHLAVRIALIFGGLAIFSYGIMLTLQSHVGLGPWDVFHQGLSHQLHISFGNASIVVGFAILLLAWALGARPGLATVLNMVLVGSYINLYTYVNLVPDFAAAPLPLRILIDVVGIALVGLGTGIYIKAHLGAGPRDGLMMALARRFGGRVSIVRGAIELVALGVGFLLGGTAGLGTILFAVLVGPAVSLSFKLLRVPVVGHR